MAILNPITNAGVLAIDKALAPEMRLQSLLRLWLGNYFTGLPFTTRAVGGGTGPLTFSPATFLWQDDVWPLNPQQAVLHTLITPAGTERLDLRPGVFGHDDRWQLDVMIKVPGEFAGTPMTGTPENMVRKIAAETLWLFSSSEREALTAVGVTELKVERLPVMLPPNTWHMRMLTATCLTRREQAR